MHIPDYYLGESTIRAFWILMLIVWIYALNQLRSLKRKRLLLVAICAALAFFITMFNVPISGGIHGLVVGGTMIALMIGPWAAVIAISLALGLQALILGYGGIWTYAANCFFMAFLTPFIGYHCYLYLSGGERYQIHPKDYGRGLSLLVSPDRLCHLCRNCPRLAAYFVCGW